MSAEDEEFWTASFRVIPGKTPARTRMNHLLKYAGAWGLDCEWLGGPCDVERLRQQTDRLRQQNDRLHRENAALLYEREMLHKEAVQLKSEIVRLGRQVEELRAARGEGD